MGLSDLTQALLCDTILCIFTSFDNHHAEEDRPGPEVIKHECSLKLKIKHNDWLLADTCPHNWLLADTCLQAANHGALF